MPKTSLYDIDEETNEGVELYINQGIMHQQHTFAVYLAPGVEANVFS